MTVNDCSTSHINHWPPDKKEKDLVWRANENLNQDGPNYQLMISGDNIDPKNLIPGQDYECN